MSRKYEKLILNKCEVGNCQETKNLHKHHIIPRTEINTNNHPMNLAILCPSHHALAHSGELKIIGLFPSTKMPNKRTLVYELNSVKNIDINQPYIICKPKSFKISEE